MPRANPDKGGRWGIMGGIFDPIHYGHLALAENAARAFDMDGVLFLVSFNPPHREKKPQASFEERLEMVSLAIADNERFLASDLEKDLSLPAYTVNIVDLLKSKYPRITDWYLVLGADNIDLFDSWHQPERLIEEVNIVVGKRPGFGPDGKDSLWYKQVKIFDMPLLELSSTMIRERIKSGKSIRYFVPEVVYHYIENKRLYQ
nr:nicotinate (nicotinamide) nucleotide adenylyltransferase [candidate division Zixibacteria bacterium]